LPSDASAVQPQEFALSMQHIGDFVELLAQTIAQNHYNGQVFYTDTSQFVTRVSLNNQRFAGDIPFLVSPEYRFPSPAPKVASFPKGVESFG
jgi:hypothetical protein